MKYIPRGKNPLYVINYEEVDDGLLVHYMDSKNDTKLPNTPHNMTALDREMERQVLNVTSTDVILLRSDLARPVMIAALTVFINIQSWALAYNSMEVVDINSLLPTIFFSLASIGILKMDLFIFKMAKERLNNYKKYLLCIKNKEAFGYNNEYEKIENSDIYIKLNDIDNYSYKDIKKMVKERTKNN